MNGIVELTISGKPHLLRFNVQACRLFISTAAQNGLDPQTEENQMKVLCDLFYAGLYGQALRDQRPLPKYPETMDLFDDFGLEADFDEACVSIMAAFSESQHGSAYLKGAEAVKKKEPEAESLVLS